MHEADTRGARRPDVVAAHPAPTLLGAALCWAAAGLIVTAAPVAGPPLAAWHCLLGASLYQAILWSRGTRPSLADLRRAALGGVGFGLSIVCLFVAYKTTTLVSANVIACLQPLVLGLIAHRSSGPLGRVLWAATGAATLGTLVVVVGSSAQGGTWTLRGDLFALAGTAANVVYVLGTKRARERMGALQFQAAMLWVAAAVLLPVALITSQGELVPSGVGWWYLLGLVTIGGTGHVLFSAAQRHVSVAASSAIVLAEVLLVSLGAALWFDQPISGVQALGMAIVAAAIGVWVRLTPGAPLDGPDEAEAMAARS